MNGPAWLGELAEQLARGLGVWMYEGPAHVRVDAGFGLTPAVGDGLIVQRPDEHVRVDAPTAIILLLGWARGLRVDLGECQACRERGYPRRGSVHATRDGQRRFAAHLRAAGLAVTESGSHGRWETDGVCSACAIDGQPTGRHTVTWERAVLDAMPQHASVAHTASDWGNVGQALAAVAGVRVESPGDQPTRNALAVQAHKLAGPEHVAVVEDWLMDGKVLADFPGEPQGGLGELVTAWLRGRCETCGGNGRSLDKNLPRVAVDGVAEPVANWVQCEPCWGTGYVLGGFMAELRRTVAATLEARAA